jgi:protoheme IX farnesyltransferase
MLVGSYVKSLHARFACPDWPLCYGRVLPPFPTHEFSTHQIMAEWMHRNIAAAVAVMVVWLFVWIRRSYRDQDRLVTTSIVALGLLLAQVVVGAATVGMTHPLVSVVHQGMAIAFFTSMLVLTVFTWNLTTPTYAGRRVAKAAAEDAGTPRARARVVADYLSVLKPRIMLLLLVSALTTMFIAAGGANLDPGIVTATLLGGAMAAGSGNAFNMYLERDIDALMTRTRNRPIPSGRLPPHHVLSYGIILAILSFVTLATFVNFLAAFLALGGAVFYIVVYTIWLKRTRPNNIVIGGAAGGFPVLVAWASVTGEVTLAALVLGFLIFLWTPPHFWAIALFRKEEYARAKIPMLPVVKGNHVTNHQILRYTVATIACSALLVLPQLGSLLSPAYLFVAMLLGAAFVWYAVINLRDGTPEAAYRLFRFSIMYLGLLFIAMAMDAIYIAPVL